MVHFKFLLWNLFLSLYFYIISKRTFTSYLVSFRLHRTWICPEHIGNDHISLTEKAREVSFHLHWAPMTNVFISSLELMVWVYWLSSLIHWYFSKINSKMKIICKFIWPGRVSFFFFLQRKEKNVIIFTFCSYNRWDVKWASCMINTPMAPKFYSV